MTKSEEDIVLKYMKLAVLNIQANGGKMKSEINLIKKETKCKIN